MSGQRRIGGVRATAERSTGGPSRGLICLLALAAGTIGGCSIYRPKPLPWQPSLASAPTVIVPAADLGGVPDLRPESIDPAKGLTETNVAALAVLGNPRLRAARRQEGVARAQLFAAGLLPDPELSGGIAKSPFFTGYTAALTEAVRALIMHGASKAAAKAQAQRVHLDLVWQEWQVAARARELYVEARTLRHLAVALGTRRRDLGRLYRRDVAALARHEVTAPQAANDLAAWNAAEADWRTLELRENANRHAFDGLLGLEPSVHLRLRRSPREPALDVAQYRSALARLPRRRPDLLALRAGYRSQEQRLREAILGQFPLLGVGVEKTRSAEEGIQSIGFNVSLSLPIFNRNRGAIAIARASRAYLYRDYRARLDASVVQADEVWTATRIMRRRLAALAVQRATLARSVALARRSLANGTERFADYVRLESAAIGVDVQAIELRGALRQAEVVLATILARPIAARP
jgi:outer membrane protein TolC